jgi:SAM-dependent methyltransferase
MTELELLVDLHKNTARQGPGSVADTLRALEFLQLPKDRDLKVADIGCGSGSQTLTLAKQIRGEIIAVDIFPEFLEKLEREAQRSGFDGKVKTLQRSMDQLDFEKESLDLIWSEGAIYIMGFEEGVKYWKQFLKPGGYIAVSEMTWITSSRPSEVEAYWMDTYPEIGTAGDKISVLEKNGFSLVGYFYLPPESWIDNYYKNVEYEFDEFMQRQGHSELAKKVVGENRQEIELYLKNKAFYSYGFYVARKD